MTWTAYIDGGSRGNPGPAAAGVQIADPAGKPVLEAGLFLGHKTNNEAEYQGLVYALELLAAAEAREIHVRSDSELLVRQMQGRYRVKAANLMPLYERAAATCKRFSTCRFEHVRREQNKRADALVNLALDASSDVVELDAPCLLNRIQHAGVKPTPPVAPPRGAVLQRPATEHRPAASGADTSPSSPSVRLTVLKGPASGACPARTRAGQVFVLSHAVPAGLCLDSGGAIIDAALAIRTAMEAGAASVEPMNITCPRPGCGAVFQLQPARP